MRYLFLLSLAFTSVAQASLTHSVLDFDQFENWRFNDQLYYSTFNEGQQWKPWADDRYTVEPLNLVDQLNLCFAHEGGWNHYFNECVIEDEDQLVDYLEAVEEAERFGFHFSAPAFNQEIETPLSELDPETLDWDNYQYWSPEKQLYFSTIGQNETEGAIIPWHLDKY